MELIGGGSVINGATPSSLVIKNFLNPKGHQNPISGSKVTAILMKGRILLIGGASVGEGLRLQPAQQACIIFNADLLSFRATGWVPGNITIF